MSTSLTLTPTTTALPIWHKLPDIVPNYGGATQRRRQIGFQSGLAPRSSSRETAVILQINPSHDRQLTCRLVSIDTARDRTIRQLDIGKAAFIERQARKQRRLDERGVTSAILLPAHLMLLTSEGMTMMTSSTPRGGRAMTERKTPSTGTASSLSADVPKDNHTSTGTEATGTTPGSESLNYVKNDINNSSSNNSNNNRNRLLGHRVTADDGAVLPSSRPAAGGVGAFFASPRQRHSVAAIPPSDGYGRSLSSSADLYSSSVLIRKRALPSLVENVDAESSPVSADVDPRFTKLLNSLSYGLI